MSAHLFEFDGFVLDAGSRILLKDGAIVRLTPKAFVSYRDGNGELYLMDADGSNLLRVTNNPSEEDRPTWSPGRIKISFSNGSRRQLGDICRER